jgi:hypothetical protein
MLDYAFFDPDAPQSSESSGYVNLGASNLPGSEDGDFASTLAQIVNPLAALASTVASFQVMRDTLANQKADRELDRFASQVRLEAARRSVQSDARAAAVVADTEIAKKQRELQFVRILNPQTIGLALAAGGVLLAWMQYRKGRR